MGLRVQIEGFEVWQLELAPGDPDRTRKVIEVRLRPKRGTGLAIPVAY